MVLGQGHKVTITTKPDPDRKIKILIKPLNSEETIGKSNAGVLLPTRNLEIELGSAIEKRQSAQIFNRITGKREGLRRMRKNGFRIWEDVLS